MIQQSNLTDVGYNGSKFTWTNNKLRGAAIAKRLDRALINCEWLSWFLYKDRSFRQACSNHYPLLVSVQSPNNLKACFRFINALTSHHQFKEIVKEAWDAVVERWPMVKFANKLKSVNGIKRLFER